MSGQLERNGKAPGDTNTRAAANQRCHECLRVAYLSTGIVFGESQVVRRTKIHTRAGVLCLRYTRARTSLHTIAYRTFIKDETTTQPPLAQHTQRDTTLTHYSDTHATLPLLPRGGLL